MNARAASTLGAGCGTWRLRSKRLLGFSGGFSGRNTLLPAESQASASYSRSSIGLHQDMVGHQW
jgi:hypothetical protein